MMTDSPNFLYIGTSKAGSTWIFKLLSWHPQIYMYPGKDIGFFTREFTRGWDWYVDNFQPESGHKVVGEVSHSYLVSEDARHRIRKFLPDAKMLVCLREPVERIFSQYLDGIKNGKITGSLDEELDHTTSLIKRSSYGTYIEKYLELFPREQIHITSFDKLVSAPNKFAEDIFEFLGVDVLEIPEKLKQKILPAGQPRVRSIAMAAKRIAKLARSLGLADLQGKAKTSPAVRNLLYRPFTDESKPTMSPEIKTRLRGLMADEIQRLDAAAGTDFCRMWHYPPAALQATSERECGALN
jgi:Sulfotransferase domain